MANFKRSRQPGLVDTPLKRRAQPKKRANAALAPNQSRVEETFKTAKPAAELRSKLSKKPRRGDRTGASSEATEKLLQPKTICALDFGTTYTGVAIVGSVNCGINDIEVLKNWVDGSRRNENFEKVLSRIAYPDENPGLEAIKFGYEVTANMKSYTWMKLLLAGVDREEFADGHLEGKVGRGFLELPSGKTAQEVVTDYLRCVYEFIMDYLEEETPTLLLVNRPIEFWLTTPACWDDETNKLSQECALAAGFGGRPKDTLRLLSEPEAALLANLSTSIDKHENIYQPDMNVCVCDIGGGTIDTQTLTILSLIPLRTKEPCVGTGAKIGMTDLEFKLHDYCEERFGDAFKNLPSEVVDPTSDFAEEFEVIKRSFDGKDLNKIYRLRLLPLKRELEAADSRPDNYDFLEGKIMLKGYGKSKFYI